MKCQMCKVNEATPTLALCQSCRASMNTSPTVALEIARDLKTFYELGTESATDELAALRAERDALAAEVERLAMSQRGILNRALIAETNEATFRKLLIESEYTLKTLPNPSIAATHLRGRITDALKTTQDVKDTK